jgi:S-adenosylmethionine hydrolase
MPDPLITLTTDFGEASPYVAAMKGVILSVNPAARLLDLTHQVPPQDVRHAAYFLAGCVPCFPRGAIHLIVVDPGVGGDRALLCVEIGGQRLLAPDNGCWTTLEARLGPPAVFRLAERRFWREPVSDTFHGRDVLAPAAGHLSLGVEPRALGPRVERWVRLALPEPRAEMNGIAGEVVFVDGFGNLLTNIPAEAWEQRPTRVVIGGREVARRVRTYGEAAAGTAVALVSSAGTLEVAVVEGNAARVLGAGVGTPVRVVLEERKRGSRKGAKAQGRQPGRERKSKDSHPSGQGGYSVLGTPYSVLSTRYSVLSPGPRFLGPPPPPLSFFSLLSSLRLCVFA